MRRLRWFLDSPLRLGLTLGGIMLAAFLISETLFDRWPGCGLGVLPSAKRVSVSGSRRGVPMKPMPIDEPCPVRRAQPASTR